MQDQQRMKELHLEQKWSPLKDKAYFCDESWTYCEKTLWRKRFEKVRNQILKWTLLQYVTVDAENIFNFEPMND